MQENPNLNLVLYSDQIIPANAAVDQQLVEIMRAKKGLGRIAYVPSGPEPSRRFFNERKSYYHRLGLDLQFVERDEAITPTSKLWSADAIHLSGGDTGSFLSDLRGVHLLEPLRNWALNGGVMVGTSAGAIIMTPSIAVDALFGNLEPVETAKSMALNLTSFEFFPHLKNNPRYLTCLTRYSRANGRPIAGCSDGGGVVVHKGRVRLIGDVSWIDNGEVTLSATV